MDEIKVKQLGNCMATDTGAWDNPTVGRVYDDDGLCPSLTRMDGGGRQPMVVDKKIVHVRQATIGGVIPVTLPGIADLSYPTSKTRRGRVIDDGQVSPTLTTENIPNVLEEWLWEIDGVWYCIRIRKLTPRECWRLMGFSDDDFEAAERVNSNTQLYKQAGNSIVKQVLMAVFKELI